MSVRPYRQQFILKTSDIEIRHILISWLAISFVFAMVRLDFLKNPSGVFTNAFLGYIIVAAITGGIGFLLHELAHKIAAQRYGCFAEFRRTSACSSSPCSSASSASSSSLQAQCSSSAV